MNKIKEFLYINNENLSSEENLRIKNRSKHEDPIHHLLFNFCDTFTKNIIIAIHNDFANSLYKTNGLVIINDEKSIENELIESIKNRLPNRKIEELSNPEKLYKGYNFFKPSTLLPKIPQNLLINVKQIGIDEKGNQINYLINPYFFACHLCYDIFVHSLYFKEYDSKVEEGLTKILEDKYGKDFSRIYHYVTSFWITLQNEATGKIVRGIDPNDLKSFTGIEDDRLINIFYMSAMNYAQENVKNLADLYPDSTSPSEPSSPFVIIKTK